MTKRRSNKKSVDLNQQLVNDFISDNSQEGIEERKQSYRQLLSDYSSFLNSFWFIKISINFLDLGLFFNIDKSRRNSTIKSSRS